MRYSLSFTVVRRIVSFGRCSWLAIATSIPALITSAQVSNSPAPDAAEATNQSPPVLASPSLPASVAGDKEAANSAWQYFTSTNTPKAGSKPEEDFQLRLEIARHQRLARLYPETETAYTSILETPGAPEAVQRAALIELGETVREENDLTRAQQIYAQFLNRWPKDAAVPEVLLNQGLVYRQMGLNNMAISKFYAVMTSALVLKTESFAFYQQLVLRAQNEIAETEYQLGQYSEAVDSFGRLLKLESPPANRSTIQHRYIHCLVALGRREEAISQAQDFLVHYPKAAERPEVRFLCARALKQYGRDIEAMQQVLALLQEEHSDTGCDAQTLAYWQRRAGNEIANEFYQQGDSMKALDIYVGLAALDKAPDWQLPVWYQIGLVFEHLNQPTKACEYYGNIARREKEVGLDAPPSLKAVVEMAKWRKDFLDWQFKAETTNQEFRATTLGQDTSEVPGVKRLPY